MGGNIALFFTGAMSKLVSHLIVVESFGPFSVKNPSFKPENMERQIQNYPALLKITPKVYPKVGDAVAKLTENNPNINLESASRIVTRSLVKVTGGYSFSHDPQLLASSIRPWEEHEVENIIRRIQCPVLVFLTKGTIAAFKDSDRKKEQKRSVEKDMWNWDLASRLKYFDPKLLKLVLVEGSHHVHLDNPTVVFPHVIKFLEANGGNTVKASL
eukprot:TRINITY_DN7587_c0_g1_i3.p1 TRINITY_DN7587_c0_g1~~TRINITY_DN7587_c0_g1_i3.p1  ORF type:complete len:214 (-),score=45.60 TRINITY_DN7587_c0_g1_i3:114-755(-)